MISFMRLFLTKVAFERFWPKLNPFERMMKGTKRINSASVTA